MCGIAGIWYRDGRAVAHQALASMVDTLVHRGPDGVGVHIGGDVGLGHRRLKVIDLSEAAAQPIWVPDRSVCMVYNGEIHNYLELAADLRKAGARLRADNDTEVLLWAYRLWGEACFERLNGMWAAAFWQPAERRLLLSRDRFGIKPLLYSIRGARVGFASEAKALLAAFPEERRPDRALVHDFAVGAVPDADEHTFFDNVRSVPPGHLLCIEPTRAVTRQHWNFRPGTEASRPDAPEAFRHLLKDSVRVRLRSDVPIGVLLSGGLDSSTVARIAVGETRHSLQCFSLRYAAASLDESRYASLVADDPARYQIHWVTPSAENLLATIGSIVWHHDAPTPLRGRYPQWHVLREASRHVTVVLGGQGADELLGGYDRFVLPFALDRLDPRVAGQYSRWTLVRDLFQLGKVSTGIHRLLPGLITRESRRRLGALARRWAPPNAVLYPLARDGAIPDRPVLKHRILGGWSQALVERPTEAGSTTPCGRNCATPGCRRFCIARTRSAWRSRSNRASRFSTTASWNFALRWRTATRSAMAGRSCCCARQRPVCCRSLFVGVAISKAFQATMLNGWPRTRAWTPSDRCCSIKSRWSAVGSIAVGSSATWAVSAPRPRNGCDVTCFKSGIC